MSVLDEITGFHIEPTNICTLKCEGCARTRFLNQWPQHWKNHCLDINALIKFLDIDLTGKSISLCGNYGDPIYHTDFLTFVEKLKTTGVKISITTNGSYKQIDWWKQLTALLDNNDTVRFSVDGVPENFTNYRINADWASIRTAMEMCASASCRTVWKYIPFAFNQDSIQQARHLAQGIGIDTFELDPSDRYDWQTQHLLPSSPDLLGKRFDSIQAWRSGNTSADISAKCQNGREHFITADGFYSPCCYVADHRFYYKTEFGKNKKSFDITHTSLSQILHDLDANGWFKTLKEQQVCQFNCPNTKSSV